MIKKSFFVAITLIVVHSLIVVKLAPDTWITRHQWQYNNLVAQKFIYGSETKDNVIVGSSLAQRIFKADPNFYMLCFSGLSSLDGLNILASRKGDMPKRVYVETNMILMQNETTSFTSSLANPFLFYARKYIPDLREGRQPIDWLAYMMGVAFVKIGSSESPSVNDVDTQKARTAFSEVNIARLDEDFSRNWDEDYVRDIVSTLEGYVKNLRSRGVEVIFFEMPMNPKLCDTPMIFLIREKLEAAFPRDQYKRIETPDCSGYTTTDGIHLTNDEVKVYEKYFLERSGIEPVGIARYDVR